MRGTSVHVFVGPSCPTSIIERLHPRATIHPPIRHGDLFSIAFKPTDVAVVIDGNYHQRLAVRHKELLEVMARGVTVIGAASIGALRAVELAPFGMRGVGRVFEWYRDGVFTQDDAVAVAHEEQTSPASVNVALVNLYAALREALSAAVIGEDQIQDLVRALAAEYYPQRSLSRVLAVLRSADPKLARWYRERLDDDPHAFDQKRRDCLQALEIAAEGEPQEQASTEADVLWRTVYVRRWGNRFGTRSDDGIPAALQLAFQQLFDPKFPEIWWEYLATCHPEPEGGFEAFLVRELGPDAVDWSKDPQQRTWITSLLRPTPDLNDRDERAVLLGRETAADRAHIHRYLEQGRRYLQSHPQRGMRFVSSAGCQELLAKLWRVNGDLAEQCTRRGFRTVQDAVDAFKPFVIGLLEDARDATPGSRRADA